MKSTPKNEMYIASAKKKIALETQRNLYSTDLRCGLESGVMHILAFVLGVLQILAFLDTNMLV